MEALFILLLIGLFIAVTLKKSTAASTQGKSFTTHYKCSKCNNEVNIHQKICFTCGARLSGVRCTNCNYTDTEQAFIRNNHHCPRCSNFHNVVSQRKKALCPCCNELIDLKTEQCPNCAILLMGIQCPDCKGYFTEEEYVYNSNMCPHCLHAFDDLEDRRFHLPFK